MYSFKPVILAAFFLFFSVSVINANDSLSKEKEMYVKSSKYNYTYHESIEFEANWKAVSGQISRDGLHLYVSALNPEGESVLFQMLRPMSAGSFKNVRPLNGKINSHYNPIMSTVSWDNNSIVFVHSATNREDDNRLYLASRSNQVEDFNDVRALNELHEPGYAYKYPWISIDGLRIYYTRQKGSELEVRYAERQNHNGYFKDMGPVLTDIQHVSNNLSVQLSGDEKKIFILSGQTIYYSARESHDELFPLPAPIKETQVPGYMNAITFTQDFQQMLIFNATENFDMEILHFTNQDVFVELGR